MQPRKYNLWWGPPRKFTSSFEERRISWLELFYDLVYVIAIAWITHHLAEHPDAKGINDYLYFFTMIFWSWLNGSLYHDIHGSPGIRTRLMTLWQIMAVAALIVCLESEENRLFNTTIAFMVLQFYITYLWWSVGIYDRAHRQYNMPYTYCFLFAIALLGVSLFMEPPIQRILFWVVAVLNFLPPFIVVPILRRNNADFSLSESMSERLGLFTIIVFGETVLGVIQGTSALHVMNASVWIHFGLGMLIVFALWWIFFAILADRESKPGFLNSHVMCIGYIPTLASLGMIGAAFAGLFHGHDGHHDVHHFWTVAIYGSSVFLFLIGIAYLTYFIHYPADYYHAKMLIRRLLVGSGIVILGLTALFNVIHLFVYLLLVFLVLLGVVVVVTRIWYKVELKNYQVSGEGAEAPKFK